MSIWRLLKHWWRGPQKKRKYLNVLDASLQIKYIHPAAQEKRKQMKRVSKIKTEAVRLEPREVERHEIWSKFSRRERDVTALTCLGFTNPQIAAYLGLSIETIRTYLNNALSKSGLGKKAELRIFFAAWNFSAWDRRKNPYR